MSQNIIDNKNIVYQKFLEYLKTTKQDKLLSKVKQNEITSFQPQGTRAQNEAKIRIVDILQKIETADRNSNQLRMIEGLYKQEVSKRVLPQETINAISSAIPNFVKSHPELKAMNKAEVAPTPTSENPQEKIDPETLAITKKLIEELWNKKTKQEGKKSGIFSFMYDTERLDKKGKRIKEMIEELEEAEKNPKEYKEKVLEILNNNISNDDILQDIGSGTLSVMYDAINELESQPPRAELPKQKN